MANPSDNRTPFKDLSRWLLQAAVDLEGRKARADQERARRNHLRELLQDLADLVDVGHGKKRTLDNTLQVAKRTINLLKAESEKLKKELAVQKAINAFLEEKLAEEEEKEM